MRSFRERFAFPLSGGKNRSSVGADTGNGAVRMLRLSALSGQALRLVGYTEAALPEAVIINGRIQNYETLSQILDRSLRSLYSGKAGNPPRKIPPAALAAALPHHQTQLGWLMPLSDGLSDQDRLNGELTRRFPHAETVGSLIRPSENRPLLFTAAERADAEALTEAYEGASLSL
ncbi:MAG: hypothetical protein Q4D82_07890, partial [Neisseria sp.]|nr:hypothetical protein [Neisseria sp.]